MDVEMIRAVGEYIVSPICWAAGFATLFWAMTK